MYALKIVTTVFNALLTMAILFFCRGLHWSNKNDKASIIGFGGMIAVYALNVLCMWVN